LALGLFSCLAGSSLVGCAVEGVDDALLEEEVGSLEQAFTVGSIHEIRVLHSNKCLDVAAAGTADGTNIQQWNCNGSNAQKFRVEARSGGLYRLVAQNGDKCVDVAASGLGDGVDVQLWTCNGTAAQDFRIELAPSRSRVGISRALYGHLLDSRFVVVLVFIKKSTATPKQIIAMAVKRLKRAKR